MGAEDNENNDEDAFHVTYSISYREKSTKVFLKQQRLN